MNMRLGAVASCTLLLAACSSVSGTVHVDFAGVERPASGSGYYVEQDSGAIVEPEAYEVVDHFEINHTFESELGEDERHTFDVGAELNPLAKQHRADAWVNVTTRMSDDDFGSNSARAAWRGVGWSLFAVGASLLAVGVAVGDGGDGLYVPGAVIGGIGGLCVVFGEAANDPATMKVSVEADAARRHQAAAPPDERASEPTLQPALEESGSGEPPSQSLEAPPEGASPASGAEQPRGSGANEGASQEVPAPPGAASDPSSAVSPTVDERAEGGATPDAKDQPPAASEPSRAPAREPPATPAP